MKKTYRSKDYNWTFDSSNGFFARWGSTFDEDPKMSPIGPEILDLEVSTICSGGLNNCKY